MTRLRKLMLDELERRIYTQSTRRAYRYGRRRFRPLFPPFARRTRHGNPIGLPRLPQTRAASFKRLYRKRPGPGDLTFARNLACRVASDTAFTLTVSRAAARRNLYRNVLYDTIAA